MKREGGGSRREAAQQKRRTWQRSVGANAESSLLEGAGAWRVKKTRLQVIGKIADFLISYRKRIREMGTNVTK